MGEWTEFEPGHRAPNDGKYREAGDNDRIMGIQNPQTVELKRGEAFPPTSKKDRKWVRAD